MTRPTTARPEPADEDRTGLRVATRPVQIVGYHPVQMKESTDARAVRRGRPAGAGDRLVPQRGDLPGTRRALALVPTVAVSGLRASHPQATQPTRAGLADPARAMRGLRNPDQRAVPARRAADRRAVRRGQL